MTREQAGIAGAIGSKIMVTVEKKTWVTTLAVTMQDPLIAATVADSVRVRLQDYVTDYRTSKARMTLEYTENWLRKRRPNTTRLRKIRPFCRCQSGSGYVELACGTGETAK